MTVQYSNNISTNQLLTIANNLSDVANVSTSRNNLGLGSGQNVTFAAIKLTTGATNGYVLTSDASGNGTWINPASTNVTTLTGTANQVLVNGTSGVATAGAITLTIASTYIGQNSITTLGTIGTGTWNGTVVAGQYGGTGVPNTGLTITLASGATGKVLGSDSSGNATWQALSSLGVTSITGTANQIAASSSTGSVTLSLTNGVSIGSYQATSPPTGGAILPGKVGIGTSSLPTTPSGSSAILTSISASSSSPVFFGSASNSQSASAGGIVTIAQDDGSPMITGARLGVITFSGATDSSHTLINSSAIASFTVEPWDSTDYGSRLSFYTTPAGGGSPSLTESVRIGHNGGVGIGSSFVATLPPAGGCIISGPVGIGTTTTTGFSLNIVPTTNVYAMANLSGTVLITDSGGTAGSQFGINNRPTFRPTSNPATGSFAIGSFLSGVFGPAGGTLTNSISVYASALFTSNAAHIVTHRGIYYDGGGSLPAGSLDNHVSLWIETPATGTNKLCAYLNGSVSIGATQVFSGISLIVTPIPTAFYLGLLTGIVTLTDTGTTIGGQRGLSVGTTFTPGSNPAAGATALNVVSIPTIALGGGTLTTSASFYAGVQFFGNAGTITTHYGYFYDGGGALSGTLTTHYGLYINQPAVGSTKICAYFGGPIQFGVNTTGATTALLATANCPATTGTSPYNWLKALAPDGSTVYIPCWK